MADLQFQLIVKDNEIALEEGSFFKAIPFEILVSDKVYSFRFENGSEGHVVYKVMLGDEVLVELGHPDYIPSVTIDKVNQELQTEDAQSLFYALFKIGISKDEGYSQFFDAETVPMFSFEVRQDHFL